jgi:hypothetical protein
MKTKLVLILSLFVSTFAWAQMNPADIAPNFIVCSDQSQTKQLFVGMSDENTAVMGTYAVTDAPGSSNVVSMNQLNISNASYNAQAINVEAGGIIDFNFTLSITANAVGEFNITPAVKTMVYIGSMVLPNSSDSFTCVVLSADQLGQLAPAN